MVIDLYADVVPLPLAARFPVELRPPEGFRPEEPATWPRVEGCLEYLEGRLLYTPPSGDVQQFVTGSIAGILDRWVGAQSGFSFGTNEAGMYLRGDVRAADAAVWEKDRLGPTTGGFPRVPPVLAVEVAGVEQDEAVLREKARWYHESGVVVVWLVLSASREVVVLTAEGESRFGQGAELAEHPALPGLAPKVDDFFRQLP